MGGQIYHLKDKKKNKNRTKGKKKLYIKNLNFEILGGINSKKKSKFYI